MNALETLLQKNGFKQFPKNYYRNNWGVVFNKRSEQYYELNYQLPKLGTLQEIYVVWEKYERCVEQLQKAIDWMEKCKNL